MRGSRCGIGPVLWASDRVYDSGFLSNLQRARRIAAASNRYSPRTRSAAARGATHTSKRRGQGIDYRHFINSPDCKPPPFRVLAFRDDLFRREDYRRIWERLEKEPYTAKRMQDHVGPA